MPGSNQTWEESFYYKQRFYRFLLHISNYLEGVPKQGAFSWDIVVVRT